MKDGEFFNSLYAFFFSFFFFSLFFEGSLLDRLSKLVS